MLSVTEFEGIGVAFSCGDEMMASHSSDAAYASFCSQIKHSEPKNKVSNLIHTPPTFFSRAKMTRGLMRN